MEKPRVVLGLLGTTMDLPMGPTRWSKWRPTISLVQQENFLVHRMELLYPQRAANLLQCVISDIQNTSPETSVCAHRFDIEDPWDFEGVYASLHDFLRAYPFRPEEEDYLVHITTGTHVAQICWFLLVESGVFPGKLLQTAPPRQGGLNHQVIDLDLARYDKIAARFAEQRRHAQEVLKSGIPTKNLAYNRLISRIEKVSTASKEPILLCGPTGSGKSKLAQQIYQLKRDRRQVLGPFIEVNCATLRGDTAMSTLFGHMKGAFTGAVQSRKGLLASANGGVLFLDEIGELGLDEQAMLLRALEEKRFRPMGTDEEVTSDFQLIAGTLGSLREKVQNREFREDLLARIHLWTFTLPCLADRPEDIEPNLDAELAQMSAQNNKTVRFNREAREAFLQFAKSPEALWKANFRDLRAAVHRMATFSSGGRIDKTTVDDEIERLKDAWANASDMSDLEHILADKMKSIDRFDRVQLEDVLRVCRRSISLSEAGRTLFSVSREKKSSLNDADRLRKYLARFELTWEDTRIGLVSF